VYDPIAVQAAGEGHDTPVRPIASLLGGLGVSWIAQRRPFQRSANAVQPDPTAVQALLDVHETPASWLDCVARAGSGADPIAQAVPFKRSTRAVSPSGSPGTLVPTAAQTLRAGHATPLKLLPTPTGASRVRWADHRVPSQRSISASDLPFTASDPTAVHAIAEAQDTPDNWLLVERPGATVGWIDQPDPSHRSLSGRDAPATVYAPTAVQAFGAQDTPASWARVEPAGSIVGWIDQPDPSHDSASGDVRPAAVYHPTAVQAVDEAHETAVRLLDVAPGAVGAASIDQVLPSKCSASVTGPLVVAPS
jgi:hypothetical protein